MVWPGLDQGPAWKSHYPSLTVKPNSQLLGPGFYRVSEISSRLIEISGKMKTGSLGGGNMTSKLALFKTLKILLISNTTESKPVSAQGDASRKVVGSNPAAPNCPIIL